jgi:hypothetical protein
MIVAEHKDDVPPYRFVVRRRLQRPPGSAEEGQCRRAAASCLEQITPAEAGLLWIVVSCHICCLFPERRN